MLLDIVVYVYDDVACVWACGAAPGGLLGGSGGPATEVFPISGSVDSCMTPRILSR